MKYLSRFNQFINESSRLMQLGLMGLNDEQKEFLDECTEGSWEFDPETGLVNIEGDFWCDYQDLTDFKGIRFGTVSGEFNCSDNTLTSLEGAPQRVGGDFYCVNNQLTSLEGAPKKVGGSFACHANLLTSLEHAPQRVGGSFYCSGTRLTSLDGAPQEVGGSFDCSRNQLTSLDGAPQQVGGSFYCTYNPDLQSLAGLPKLHDVEVPKHLEERLELMREEARKLKSKE